VEQSDEATEQTEEIVVVEPPSTDALDEARRAIEAILLVATDPTSEQLLAQLLELPVELVGAICRELADDYEAHNRGFQLVAVAGGWRYQTHPDLHPYVERYALEGIPNRLSGAALETLAIIAYKQPISRAQVSAIRGVNVDGVLRTLVQRGYVIESGKDDGPGQAALFSTSGFFLEQLGLMSLDDLPALGEFVPSAEVLEALEQTLRVGDEPEPVEVDVEQPEEPAPVHDLNGNGSTAHENGNGSAHHENGNGHLNGG
jgi:segregation and condensation protein B